MQQLCFAITIKAMEIDGNISYHRRCSKIASLSLPTPTKPVGRASVRVLQLGRRIRPLHRKSAHGPLQRPKRAIENEGHPPTLLVKDPSCIVYHRTEKSTIAKYRQVISFSMPLSDSNVCPTQKHLLQFVQGILQGPRKYYPKLHP